MPLASLRVAFACGWLGTFVCVLISSPLLLRLLLSLPIPFPLFFRSLPAVHHIQGREEAGACLWWVAFVGHLACCLCHTCLRMARNMAWPMTAMNLRLVALFFLCVSLQLSYRKSLTVGGVTEAAQKLFGLDDPATGIALDCIRLRLYIPSTQVRKKVYDVLTMTLTEAGIYTYQVGGLAASEWLSRLVVHVHAGCSIPAPASPVPQSKVPVACWWQELYLETREPSETWVPFDPEAITLRIIKYDSETDELLPEVRVANGPVLPRCPRVHHPVSPV